MLKWLNDTHVSLKYSQHNDTCIALENRMRELDMYRLSIDYIPVVLNPNFHKMSLR